MDQDKKKNKPERESLYPGFDPLGTSEQPVYRSIGAVDLDGKPVYRSVGALEFGNDFYMGGNRMPSPYEPFRHKPTMLKPQLKQQLPPQRIIVQSKEETETKAASSSVNVPALPAAPFPVDHYHYHCRAAPDLLLEKLSSVLKEHEIDFELNREKCKFKAVKYVDYESIVFIARLYSSGQDDIFLVEFQRRSGSILAWDKLYASIYHKMLDLIDTCAPASPQSGGQKKVTNELSRQNFFGDDLVQKTSAVGSVVDMIKSKYLDTQLEGCSAIASLSKNSSNAEAFVREGALQALATMLNSADNDIRRCAVSSYANISKVVASSENEELTALANEGLSSVVDDIMAMLSAHNATKFLELQRECARALLHMSTLCSEEIIRNGGIQKLQRQGTLKDERLTAHLNAAVANLC